MKKIKLFTLTIALLSTSAMASYNTEKATSLEMVGVISQIDKERLSLIPALPPKKKKDNFSPDLLQIKLFENKTTLLALIPALPPKKKKEK